MIYILNPDCRQSVVGAAHKSGRRVEINFGVRGQSLIQQRDFAAKRHAVDFYLVARLDTAPGRIESALAINVDDPAGRESRRRIGGFRVIRRRRRRRITART